VRYYPARAAFVFRPHPTIDAADMVASHRHNSIDAASFGDNGFSRVKLIIGHAYTFAIIANIVNDGFAIIALAFFAQFANGERHG
jgi:hypothetical protein